MSDNSWNWSEQRQKTAFLALEDGTILRGRSVGAPRDNVGEVVFNTGMTGYQEILTDPSYCGQFVTMTYPEIGNTGINTPDHESRRAFLNGFIMHQMNEPENWRSEQSLTDFLIASKVPAIAGLDTRALTSRLRTEGTLKGCLAVSGQLSESEAIAKAKAWSGLDGVDTVATVTADSAFEWDPDGSDSTTFGLAQELPTADMHVVAYDFGIKYNILRNLRACGMRVTVVPASTPAAEVLAKKPDGVFFSNGPGDPAGVPYAINNAKEIIGKVPVMGICLGHQLLSLACGAKSYRLKFGHHGCNHPVKDLETGAVEITSQNHNFAIDADTFSDAGAEITHVNLNDNTVEGVRHKREPMFAIQYHPEAAPGPHDPQYLFNRFRQLIADA